MSTGQRSSESPSGNEEPGGVPASDLCLPLVGSAPAQLMGALIDAASPLIGKDTCIADPFSGGGTVAIEAARRGFRIYAQESTLGQRGA